MPFRERHELYSIIQLLGHTNVIVSISVSSIVCSAALLMGGFPTWKTAVVPFLITYWIYNFDRLADKSGIDKNSSPERTLTMMKYNKLIRCSGILFLISAILISASIGIYALIITAFFPLAGVIYTQKIFPVKKYRCIKDIPFLKSFYVPACLCMAVIFNVVFLKLTWHGEIWVVMFFVYLRIFYGVLICDIRDFETDIIFGTKTIAACFGKQGSYWLLNFLNFFSCVFLLIAAFSGWMNYAALRLIPAIIYAQIILFFFGSNYGKKEFLTNLSDSECALYFPLLIFLR